MKHSPELPIAVLALMLAVSAAPARASDPVDADSFINQGSSVDPSASSNNAAQLQMLMQQSQLQAATHPSGAAIGGTALTGGQPKGPTSMWLLGVGSKTCKEWLDAKASLGWQGDEWAQGYWTGLNTLNDGNHDVGKSLPATQILAAVRAKCTDHDDKTIQLSVSEAYVDAMKAGQ